ncbi:hypothetical protein EDF66_113121 [Sphingobacterium sp. JUb20]|nr:hypothetical protein [Sphingobacterium sp. JUb21]TCQ99896.1 hypothetical protein EDF66_113121 [Sphingobacterium sp. JUb20]
MKKTCKGDNYSLSPGEGLSSYLSKNPVDVIKKFPILIFIILIISCEKSFISKETQIESRLKLTRTELYDITSKF